MNIWAIVAGYLVASVVWTLANLRSNPRRRAQLAALPFWRRLRVYALAFAISALFWPFALVWRISSGPPPGGR